MKKNSLKYKFGQFLLFAGPSTFFLCAVVVIPFIYGIYLTFTGWNGVSRTKAFVGLANYATAFADAAFWISLGRTMLYMLVSVVLVNIVAFLLAYLVTRGIKGQNFFRAAFFVPNLIGGIVLGYAWKFVFSRALVAVGKALGIKALSASLLATTGGSMFCLVLVSVWQYAGYMMLIYIAGIVGISKDLLEAAKIDGCTENTAVRYITIPLLRSSFMQCMFLTIIRCVLIYDVNLSLTNGEPFASTVLSSMYVYDQAFIYNNYSLGQTEAVIIFVICAIIGLLQAYFGKKGETIA